MAGTILTPVAIWRNFIIDSIPTATVISQTKAGGVTLSELNIKGRTALDGEVRIYARLYKGKATQPAPAILLPCEFERSNEYLALDLAKKGYYVLCVDIAGRAEGKQHFTQYPESLSYANYENVKDKLYEIKGDVNQTCWYEWTAVVRYALSYLKSLEEVSYVGGLGVGESCTVMWQVAGMDENLDCVCFALNAGWNGYRGIYKFSGQVEPQFTDDMYKFIAGVEPQAYAMHVKCPTLVLSATNSNVYDCDRAYDTVSRIDEQFYRAVHYSVGSIDNVNAQGYMDALIFFDGLLKAKKDCYLPAEMDIKCDIVDGKIVIEVVPDGNNLKEIAVYVSEETILPALRAWQKITECKKIKDGKVFLFEYSPYPNSNVITAFAQAGYKSNFVIGSSIISKKFTPEEVRLGHKSNIIYSSRKSNAESLFIPYLSNSELAEQILLTEDNAIKVKKGAKGIEGVCCASGLTTFKVNSVKDKPKADAILMFDAHAKTDIDLVVKLICNFYDERVEYIASVKVFGGEIWTNVKLTENKFKTVEGRPLKSFDNVNAISFVSNGGEFIINNALWV